MKREEIELCFNCQTEIHKIWDVEKDEYQIPCTKCGEKIMLCDACLHSEDNKEKHCDWTIENGCLERERRAVDK